MRTTAFKHKLAAGFIGVVLSLLILELGLRLTGYTFLAIQNYRNAKALRARGEQVILCVGESTTAMGGHDAYPRQLEEVLNEQAGANRFTVINKGLPMGDTSVILHQLETFDLDRYRPDMVVAMMGANDSGGAIPVEAVAVVEKEGFLNYFKTYRLIKLLLLNVRTNKHRAEPGSPGGNPAVEHFKTSVREGFPEAEELNLIVRKERQYELEGRFTEAEAILRETAKTNPISAQAHLNLGQYLERHGHYPEALHMLEKAIRLDQNLLDAYYGLGICHEDRGDYEAAKESYRQGLEISFTPAAQSVAPPAAKSEGALRTAVATSPSSARTNLELGKYLVKQERYEEAREFFQKTVMLAPLMVDAYYGLGMCHEAGEDSRAAAEMFKKAMNISLNQTHVEQCRFEQALSPRERSRLSFVDPAPSVAPDGLPPGLILTSRTSHNYRRLKEILDRRRIKLVCVQYPGQSVDSLKRLFPPADDLYLVDNETIFKQALSREPYGELFMDRCYGDFGHGTRKGNRLLAENIADTVLKVYAREHPAGK